MLDLNVNFNVNIKQSLIFELWNILELIIQIITDRAMSFKEFINNTILRMDMLSCSPTLRVRKEPQYQSIFGGLLSLIILGTFTYAFYVQISQTLNKLSITYTQTLSDQISSDSSITNLQFAVSIEGVDLTISPKKFIFQLKQIKIAPDSSGTAQTTKTSVTLSPCQLSDWSELGQSFETQYSVFGFSKMLCLPPGSAVQLLGYAGSTDYKYLELQIQMCNQTSDSNCDSSSNINSYMTSYLSTNDYFKVKFYIVDTLITPTNQDFIVEFLQKNIFMSFTQDTGTFGYINFAQATIETDQSLLPFQNIEEQSASFIQDFYTNTVSISSTKYVALNFYKSTKSLSISRTIGKIDEVLSYVGGLFSLVFSAILFFIGSYSEMKYQIYVAQSLLTNQKGQRITEQDFGFITYLKYSIYDWLETFGIAPQSWSHLSSIHQLREQTCEQMDLVILMKRVKYLQEANKSLMNQQKNVTLYLTKHMDISQSKKMRNMLTFTDNVFDDIYSKDLVEPSQMLDKQLNTNMQMIKSNDKNLSQVKKGQTFKQENEQQIFKNIIFQSLLQLEKDNSQIGQRIKQRISEKARQKLIQLCKKEPQNDRQDFKLSSKFKQTKMVVIQRINSSKKGNTQDIF